MRIRLVQDNSEILKQGRVSGVCLQNSTLKKKVIDCFDDITETKAKELREKVWGSPHSSVFEFIKFTFLLEDVSLVVELFLIQHRIASFNIKSRRYVDFSEQGFCMPKLEFTKELTPEEKNKIYTRVKAETEERFRDYEKLVKSGEETEDARYILPLCLNSNIIFEMNAVEIYKMIRNGMESGIPEIISFCSSIKETCSESMPDMFSEVKLTERRTYELDYSQGIYISPATDLVRAVEDHRSLDGMSENRYLFESFTGLKYKNNKEVAKEFLSDKIKENSKINEFMDFLSPGVSFFQVKLTVAAFTHLVRHRMQSIIAPPLESWGSIKTYNIKYEDSEYKTIIDKQEAFKKELIDMGVSERSMIYFMLSGDYIRVSHKANLREFVHMCNLRLCSRAQEEIREIIKKESEFMHKVSYNFLEIMSPSCISKGVCKEGKMGCGTDA